MFGVVNLGSFVVVLEVYEFSKGYELFGSLSTSTCKLENVSVTSEDAVSN